MKGVSDMIWILEQYVDGHWKEVSRGKDFHILYGRMMHMQELGGKVRLRKQEAE